MVNKILRAQNELGTMVTILNCMDVRRSFISIKEIYILSMVGPFREVNWIVELGGIPVLVVTQGIDFIPVLFFRIPVYCF